MKHDHPVEADHRIQHEYPANVRFCPLCGGDLGPRIVVPDHKQQKVCKRCGFIYFVGPKLVAGCLIADGDRILLLRRGIEPSLGKWTFPGGYVDLGETPIVCARRETFEEVAMNVSVSRLFGIYGDRRSPVAIIVVYLAAPGAEHPSVTPEATEVRYFTVDQIPWDELAFDTTIQALEDWVAEVRKTPQNPA
jgi:8-oxo-dGTP diphosphatase